MKNPWIAAVLNFFTLGLGTLYVGKRMGYGLLLLVGGALMIYVELSLKQAAPELYWYSFSGFFALALATAWDGYNEASSK